MLSNGGIRRSTEEWLGTYLGDSVECLAVQTAHITVGQLKAKYGSR
ncbi:MAG: hypothetical protein IT349_09045 [Candidatus Eisenbacteria bacterium]|nr:hypothetical protein [Candidatus Eisenbacteria bacterium]